MPHSCSLWSKGALLLWPIQCSALQLDPAHFLIITTEGVTRLFHGGHDTDTVWLNLCYWDPDRTVLFPHRHQALLKSTHSYTSLTIHTHPQTAGSSWYPHICSSAYTRPPKNIPVFRVYLRSYLWHNPSPTTPVSYLVSPCLEFLKKSSLRKI